MYKKGVRSMPRTIRREVARACDTSMTVIGVEVVRHYERNGIDFEDILKNPFPFPLDEVNPALAEKIHKALSDIEDLPSYWLLTPFTTSSAPYIVFECKLKVNVEQLIYEALKPVGFFELPSDSQYYGIY